MVNPTLGSASMSRSMGRNQAWERKAMAKKRARKRQVWNKGLEVGKRDGFTPDQVKRIRGLLADRGVPGLRDLALFSTAIDTMLHGQDLLALVVGDVQRRDGSMRPIIEVARARGMPPVRCALSNASTKALEKWITASGKKRTNYLFPGRGVEGRHPMGPRQLNRLLKLWVVEAGLDATRRQRHWIYAFRIGDGRKVAGDFSKKFRRGYVGSRCCRIQITPHGLDSCAQSKQRHPRSA